MADELDDTHPAKGGSHQPSSRGHPAASHLVARLEKGMSRHRTSVSDPQSDGKIVDPSFQGVNPTPAVPPSAVCPND